MENLQNLIKTALIGTARREFVAAKSDLATINLPENISEEEKVLRLSLLYSRIRRTGFRPAKLQAALPKKAEKENLRACSDLSAYHLLKVIESKSLVGIKDFLEHLGKADRHIPGPLLPEILDLGLKQKEWQHLIEDTMGNRGRWLAKQNPAWNFYHRTIESDAWEVGTRIQRAAWLAQKREENPQFALDSVMETWSSDSGEDRLAFLPILAINLSEHDEAFIIKCQADKRKSVKKEALELLYKIKTSQVNQRIQNRLKTYLSIEKKRLELTLPDAFDDSMKQDGILEITPGASGQKGSWIRQMTGIVPPSFWTTHFNLSPEKVLALFYNSDWKEVLFNGLITATLRHDNKKYVKTLLDFWEENRHDSNLKAVQFNQLFHFLTEPIFQKNTIAALKKDNILDDNNSVTQLLMKSINNWTDELSLAVFEHFSNSLEASMQNWMVRHFKKALKIAAYSVNPKLHDKLGKYWPQESILWRHFEGEITDFLATLKFREQLIIELYKNQ